MRKIFLRLLIIFLGFFVFFHIRSFVHASVPYEASDVLGQPDFESNAGNFGYLDPNEYGFASDTGLSPVLDSVHHRLFVSDAGNCRVLIFNLDSSNNLIDKTADNVLGQVDFSTATCDVGSSALSATGQLAYDSVSDRLFVTDTYNCRVVVYDTTVIENGEPMVSMLGGTDMNTYGDCGISQSSFIGSTGGIAYDELTHWLYVGDATSNKRILVFDLSGGITNGMSASYVLGSSDFTTPGLGDVTSTGIADSYSSGMIIDSVHHRLFFNSYTHRRVLVFDVLTITNGEPAVAVLGQDNLTSNVSNISQQGHGQAMGIGYDSVHQLLYLADYTYSRIMIYDVNTIQNGENAVGVIGTTDFVTGGEYNTTSNHTLFVDYMGDIAFDPANRRIYYGDDYNSRILIFDFAHLIDLTNSSPSIGSSISQTLGSGYQGTTTYTLDSGSLPPGVTFNTLTGLLSGSYTTAGSYTFTITISDDNSYAGTYTDTKTYTVTISSSGTGGSSPRPEGEYSTTDAPICRYTSPLSAPNLFNLQRTGTDVLLHFTPIPSNTSYYFISYGTDATAEGYSLEIPQPIDTTGAISQDIHMLNPNKTYYFKVRAGNNCMPGPWSSVVK